MPALLDTNAISDLMANHPPTVARAGNYSSGPLHTCTVAVGEIRYGIERLPTGKRRSHLEARSQQVLSSLLIEPITDPISDEYGRLKASLETQGLNLDDNDLWIAATALLLNYSLVTRDKIFTRIPGLLVEDWSQ